MAKDRTASAGMWFGELFQLGLYKRTQGKIARQVTFFVLAVTAALCGWRIFVTFGASLNSVAPGLAYGVFAAVTVVGLWVSFRVVNVPRFADFLISVEAEMNKVSWPSRAELLRASVVVIVVIFVLSGVLFGFDLFWGFVFEWLGVIRKGG